jgi:hypothetical protein
VTPNQGSISGGTLITLKGSGFGIDPKEVTVLVGSSVCEYGATGGVSDSFVTCSTPPGIGSKPVTLTRGRAISNSVSFNYNKNPVIEAVIPWGVKAGESINIMGNHQITDVGGFLLLGDIILIQVGNYTCDRIPVNDPPIDATRMQNITCFTSKYLTAGLYNMTMKNVFGFYSFNRYARHYSPSLKMIYHAVSRPIVTELSSATGSLVGNILTLTGQNFNVNGPLTVEAAGQPCVVQEFTSTQIVCKVDKIANPATETYGKLPYSGPGTQKSGYVGSAGLIRDTPNYYNTYDQISIDMIYYPGVYQVTSSSRDIQWQIYSSSIFTIHMTAYVHMPVKGSYRFFGKGDNKAVCRIFRERNTAPNDVRGYKLLFANPSFYFFYDRSERGSGDTNGYFDVP